MQLISTSIFFGIISVFSSFVYAPDSHAIALRTGFDASTLAANDDGSTGALNIGFDVNFFGVVRNTLFVNNNGNLTFNSAFGSYTAAGLSSVGQPIIAPFFTDVDTRGVGSGLTRYGAGLLGGFNAFGATWRDVGYYSRGVDKLNTFQAILVQRSDTGLNNFDIEFNYDTINFETGAASGGVNGLGGSSARAGYANGAGTFFELPGSAVNGGLLDTNLSTGLINNRLNSSTFGRYTFEVRDGAIAQSVPFGFAPNLSLAALGGLWAAKKFLTNKKSLTKK